MTQHLVLPYFLRSDVLANADPDFRKAYPKIDELAHRSVQMVDPSSGRAAPQVTLEQAQGALAEGMKQLGLSDETIKAYLDDLVQKTVTDPVVLLQPYSQPSDFAYQYPQPLDPTEILTLCEETRVYQALPEVVTPFNADSWREMDALEMSGDGATNDGFFLKGGCPDTHTRAGDNLSRTRMYLGDQTTLAYEDVQHSLAVAAMRGLGISAISTQDRRVAVADAKAKEMLSMEILVVNNWDRALVSGNDTTNTLAFDGIETQVTSAAGARTNANPTGQFDVETFDQFLAQGCARPTHIFGHPMAIREIKLAYLQLGAASTQGPIMQVVVTKDGQSIVPGFQMADMIDTAVGRLTLVPDFRFTATQVQPDRFHSIVYPLRLYHNGEPIVYKSTQTPLSFKDLAPGCTAISFMIYAVTALVIKHMCAQAAFQSNWPGRVETGCTIVENS
jgi:hypothetical protein